MKRRTPPKPKLFIPQVAETVMDYIKAFDAMNHLKPATYINEERFKRYGI